jgi:hypothetical protein
MMSTFVYAVDIPGLPPFEMPTRINHDIIYFATPAGDAGAPQMLERGHWWVRREDALRIYEDGVVRIVSPLDSSTTAELEITEEQEALLKWLNQHHIEHLRFEQGSAVAG